MGMKHDDLRTYPQVGKVIGFIPKDKAEEVCEKILTIQRDYGDRSDRMQARFKYTVDRKGLDWIKQELNDRLGWN